MRIAAFTGSFDPYTIGHDDIVRRALPLFDHIVIGVGYNEHKQYMQSVEERCSQIRSYYKDEPKVQVESYRDLTVDFCQRIDAQFIIKGVRTLKDFEYEQEMADINRQLSGVETILFLAAPELSHISSSMSVNWLISVRISQSFCQTIKDDNIQLRRHQNAQDQET